MDRERWTDDKLLAATAEDPEAFAVFYRRHVKALLAYLVYRVRDGEQAVDLCSEVFAAALESSGRFRTRTTPARAWLFGIANNKVAESVRRGQIAERARQKLGIGPVAACDDDYERVEALVDSERREVPLSALLDDLPQHERAVVRARVIDELSFADIARLQGVSEQVARKRLSRGLARLTAWGK